MKIKITLIALLLNSYTGNPSLLSENFIENFNNDKLQFFEYHTLGKKLNYKFATGEKSMTDTLRRVLKLTMSPEDTFGPIYGPEVYSLSNTHFGTYSASLKIPDVSQLQPNVAGIVGLFTYLDENHPLGMSEIDFEWHLSDPRIVTMGTFTGTPNQRRRIERVVNLATGEIVQTVSHLNETQEKTILNNYPKAIFPIPDFNASTRFYTYGFDWFPDKLEWWLIDTISKKKTVLWTYNDTRLGFPIQPATFRANIWNTPNWAPYSNPKALEIPKFPYELEVDWMKYEKF